MATVNKNLSDHDPNLIPDASQMKFGIVASEWNEHVTNNLLEGAYKTLIKNGTPETSILVKRVPGAYELPLAAKWMTDFSSVDAVICLGSVIRGETSHFDYVCEATALGIKDVNLQSGIPVIFGVLTDDTNEQAVARSGGIHGNKGDEAAVTAIKMVALRKELSTEGI